MENDMRRFLLITALVSFGLGGAFAGSKATPQPYNELEHQYVTENETEEVDNNSFPYFGVHVHPIPLPFPGVNAGYRYKKDSFAIDTSIKFTTAIVANAIQGDLNFYRYIEEFYIGGGFRIAAVFGMEDNIGLIGLNFVLGKEFRNEGAPPKFMQLELYYPNYIYTHEVISLTPGICLKYGWGF
jgi:hypothetical protein